MGSVKKMTQQLAEGEQFAYLHGESRSDTENALRASPAMRRELAELARLDQLLTGLFAEIDRPDPQDLVDVLTNQATPKQKLIVAAYTRFSERGRREMAALEEELALLEKSEKPRSLFAFFLARPFAPAVGLRTGRGESGGSLYQAIDIQVQVILHRTPPVDLRSTIEGVVTQHFKPMSHQQLALQSGPTVVALEQTDDQGFFRFQHLQAGTYQLSICLEDGIVQIENVVLNEDS